MRLFNTDKKQSRCEENLTELKNYILRTELLNIMFTITEPNIIPLRRGTHSCTNSPTFIAHYRFCTLNSEINVPRLSYHMSPLYYLLRHSWVTWLQSYSSLPAIQTTVHMKTHNSQNAFCPDGPSQRHLFN